MVSPSQTSAACFVLLLGAPPAAAQPAPGPPAPSAAAPAADEPTEADSDLVARAITLRKQGEEAVAIGLLREAYASERTPRISGHLGLAERALGLARDAEQHLSEALAATDDQWVRANQQLLSDALRYAQRQLAWVRVVVGPTGVEATVRIAGEPASVGQRVRVKAGSVTVEASAKGYRSKNIRTELAPEKELLVTLNLTPLPLTQPARQPPSKPPPSARAGALPGPIGEPAGATSSQTSWAYVSGGVGLVGLGLATYFGLQALDHQATAKDLCPETRCTNRAGVDADSAARRDALYSDLSLGVGVIALGVSIYLLLSDTKPAAARSNAQPWAAPGGGGARWAF